MQMSDYPPMTTSVTMLVGPLLVGAMISYYLFGIYLVQLYHYFHNYGGADRKLIVLFVYGVTVLEILHLVFATHMAFQLLARGFSNPEILHYTPWSATALPPLNGFVALTVQIFFAWRISQLTQKSTIGRLFAALIVLLGVMQAAAALAVAIQYDILLEKDYTRLRRLTTTITVWLAGSFTCDFLISAGMVVVLLRCKTEAVQEGSKNFINRWIVRTIENGVITTVCALPQLVCFTVRPDVWLYIMFELMLGRLYANVLLASLNGRGAVGKRTAATASISWASRPNGSGPSNAKGEPHLSSFPVFATGTQGTQDDRDSTTLHGGTGKHRSEGSIGTHEGL